MSQLEPQEDTPAVPASSRGLLYGDGVFITLGIRDGTLLDAGLQMNRIHEAAQTIGLQPPDRFQTPLAGARSLAAIVASLDPTVTDGVARLQWFAGSGSRGFGRGLVQAEAIVNLTNTPETRRVSIVILPDGHVPLPALPRHKTCSSLANILCAREALHRGVEAAVRVDSGVMLETASANLFWIHEGTLFTPADSLPLYPGSMRERILECAPTVGLAVEEGAYAGDCLTSADTVFVANAARGMEVVRQVDGRPLDQPPVILARLETAVEDRRRELGILLDGAVDADA